MKIESEKCLDDPLLAAFDLSRSAILYPLGFPVEITTNSENVLRAARQTWADSTQDFDHPPVRIQLGVIGDGPESLPLPPAFRGREHLVSIIGDASNFLICDLLKGFGFGWVTKALTSETASFRYYFLDAAMLMMIEQLYLAPIHAGLVERNGHGVLLCGESFAGKSTLTYACARSGWTLISDDGTFLVRERDDRYGIGNPRSMRFREDARSIFPELASRLASTRPNGKNGIEVPTRELPGIKTATRSRIDHIVFLNRHAGGAASLKTVSKSETWDRVAIPSAYGVKKFSDARMRSYHRLLTAGSWQLNYGDLDSAVERLEQLAASGS